MKLKFAFAILLFVSFQLVNAQTGATYDQTFSEDGLLEFKIPDADYSSATGLEKQADGKTLVISTVYIDAVFSNGFAVNRINTDGTPDQGFGDNGTFFYFRDSFFCTVNNIHVLDNGKVVFGATISNPFDESGSYFALFRLNADGTPDQGFGTNGIFAYDINYFPTPSAFGTTVASNGDVLAAFAGYDTGNLFLVKFLPNGDLDVNFGTNGVSEPALENLPSESLISVAPVLLPSGEIIVLSGGETFSNYTNKFDANGSIQTNYGDNGLCTIKLPQFPYSVYTGRPLLHSNGNLYVSGYSLNSIDEDNIGVGYLASITPDGLLDQNFGANGYVSHNLGFLAAISTSMIEMPDGGILNLAAVLPDIDSDGNIGFFKIKQTGELDQTFGQNGAVAFLDLNALAFDSYMTSDYKVVVSGEGYEIDGTLIARFNLSGISAVSDVSANRLEMQLAPNPATDHLNLSWSSETPANQVALLDMQGRMIQQYDAINIEKDQSYQLSLPNLQSGAYVLRVSDAEGRSVSQKFMRN